MNVMVPSSGERTHGHSSHERADRGPLDPAPTTFSRTGLIRHIAVYVVANMALWGLDLTVGAEGIQWAQTITLALTVALIVHVVAFLGGGRGLEDPKYAQNYRDIGKRWGGL